MTRRRRSDPAESLLAVYGALVAAGLAGFVAGIAVALVFVAPAALCP